MAVTDVDVSRAVNTEQYANYLRKTVTYRVLCSSATDGPDVVTGSASIPTIDSSTYSGAFKYGSDVDNANLICRKHSNFRKTGPFVWTLDADFEYDLEKTPAARGVVVTPSTRSDRRIVRLAEFKGWYEPKPSQSGARDFNNLQELAGTFPQAVVVKNKQSPVMNSAGTPNIPPLEEDYGVTVWTLEWLKLSGVNFDAYIGRTNSGTVNITSITQGIDADFSAGSLKLVGAGQSPVWIYNQRMFMTRVELEIWPAGSYADVFELDQGLAEKLYTGDNDGKGGTVDSFSMPLHELRVISENGKPLSHPVPFDGEGKAIQGFTPEDAVYLRWRTAPPFNFNVLEIGDYT